MDLTVLNHSPSVICHFLLKYHGVWILQFNISVLRSVCRCRFSHWTLTRGLVSPQERFTQDTQPHYIYSPREMTRWVRGIFEALRPLETLPVEGLIRIWAHEALRLFQDR